MSYPLPQVKAAAREALEQRLPLSGEAREHLEKLAYAGYSGLIPVKEKENGMAGKNLLLRCSAILQNLNKLP